MCLTQVGTVTATLAGECLVEIDGTERRLLNLLPDGPSPGDRVLTGLGRVVALLTPDEAAEAEALEAQLTRVRSRGEP
jgi:hypothetical protein